MSEFKNLIVWQKSMDMVVKIYPKINMLPKEERFCLGQQMRNSAVSVPSNIAEGQARNSIKEFIHHLNFSKGSAAELETQLLVCERLGYLEKDDINDVIEQLHLIDAMINKLIFSLKKQL